MRNTANPSAIATVEKKFLKDHPPVAPGDTVKVHVRIKEGDKERVQVFEGTVIAMANSGTRKSFTVRKISHGVGVERVFPLHATTIAKIEKVDSGRVRRSKLYYLRERAGKAARLKSDSEVQ